MSSPVTSIISAAGVKLGLAVAVLRRIGGSREVPVTEQSGLTSHCVFRDCITPFLLEIRSGEKWRQDELEVENFQRASPNPDIDAQLHR